VLFFAAKGLCQLLALWVRKRNFFSLAASRSEAKKLWLNKVAVKSRREVVVAQHSRHKNIPTPASSHPKPDGDRKCIVPVVEDVSFENPTGKAPPECGQVPFAAEDGRRVKRRRQRIVLHRNPKKAKCVPIVNPAVACAREDSGIAPDLLRAYFHARKLAYNYRARRNGRLNGQ
jgi:hypothetical protein